MTSCADMGSLEVDVNAFMLYSCDISQQQYHQQLLVVTKQGVHDILFIMIAIQVSDSGAISRLPYT